MQCPVKPYSRKLGMDMLKEDNVKDMTYGAADSKGRTGRYLHLPAIDNKHYFSYNNTFETNRAYRGLVCITYIGAVYGVGASKKVKNDWDFKDKNDNVMEKINVMSAYGTQLAKYLDAKKVNMEAKKKDELKAFFKKNPKKTYLMWSSGHTVLVVDGEIHEFTNHFGADKGYHHFKTDDYRYENTTWWVRELERPAS